MKFLIAGYGSIGRRHLRNLRELNQADVLLLRSRKSTLPEDEIAGLPVETDIEAALAHKPDAVIVANPTALHLDVAIPAARLGCAILLEKPVAERLERLAELREAVQQGGSRVLVGFQLRYHPTLREAAARIAADELGRVTSARAHWGEYLPNWHPWEDFRQGYAARPDLGGGVTLTLCHPFDYLRWLLGEYEVKWAGGGSLGLGLEVEDSIDIGLSFRSGAAGALHLDYIQRPPSHALEIIGTEGTLRWDGLSGDLMVYKAVNDAWTSITSPEGFERNWLFLEEMRHFTAVAKGEETPLCTLEDGARALELALAARDGLKAV